MTSFSRRRSVPLGCVLAAGLFCSLAVWARGESAETADVWSAPAFSASPAALLAAKSSSSGPEEAETLILLCERLYRIDAQGRQTIADRLIYRVLDESAIEDWSSVEAAWAPWYQEKPTVRARVVTPDGKEHLLDPKTIAEESPNEGSRLLYGDRRRLRAPLPAVTAGSVVEQEIVTRENAPFFDGGSVSIFLIEREVPVERTRMEIEAPKELELATVSHVTPSMSPRKEEREGRVRLIWELGRRDAKTDWEVSAPSDSAQSSYIAFGTGRSWSDVARRYSGIVDGQTGSADLHAAVAEAAGTAAKDRAETIARVLAWIQKRIRYTGVEFSEATIVPRPPAETLRRGYGDCKDKASLLAAMLRQAGIPAYLALLKTGPGPDVDRTLYGLGAFDHAIVFVPGPPEIWIDPTESFARAGQLPNASQDRLALIARDGTTELLRTPAAAPSDNTQREVREFFLAERGNSRVVETTESTGAVEISERHAYSDANHKQLQESVDEYAHAEYLSKGATTFSHSDTADLSKPFTVRIETPESGRGTSLTDQAVVAILPATLTRSFPLDIQSASDDSEETTKPSRARSKRRTLDYVYYEPFVAEFRYRIHPAEGFRSAPLPDSKEENLGVAHFSRQFSVDPDGSVLAVLKVDVVKRRLTAAEFEATREAVSKLAKTEATFIRFEQVGQSHLAAGRVKEALLEFRRLAALHPKEALHETQIAMALLQGGLGDAAREEARKATALEPKSALAWRTLAWVLQHDSLGRRFRTGFLRDEAIADYRKSRDLDSSDLVTRGDLAILLEHNADGVRYGRGADLAGAISEYRSLRKDLKSHGFDINLCAALMWAERFDEMAEAARELDSSATREQFLILGATLKDGAPAGLAEASRLVSDADKKRKALETVGRTLIQIRRYPEASALLSAAVSGSPNAAALRAQADLIGKARRHEEAPLDEKDPRSLLPRMITVVFEKPHLSPADLAPFVASSVASEELDPEKESLRSIRAMRRTMLPQFDGPPDFIIDVAVPVLRQDIEGDDESGYRLRMSGAGPGAFNEVFFLVREGGLPRLLAEARNVSPLGAEALRRVEAGRLPAARRLLDWARDELRAGSADDPLSGSPFSSLWTKGQEADANRIRLAAAALAVGGPSSKSHIETLVTLRPTLQTDLERAACDHALVAAYVQGKDYEKALPLVDRLAEQYPQTAGAFRLRVLVLFGLKRFSDVRVLAQARLDRIADDPDALRMLFRATAFEGDYAGVEKWGRRLTALPSAEAEDYNSLAWNSLFLGGATEQAIDDSRRAVDLTKQADAASLHTLATLYAETGKTAEARELILKSLDVGGKDVPAGSDWYVFGRVAEEFGEMPAAVAAYRKVTRPQDELDLPESTFLLASRRLKSLGADRPEKSRS